jgi:RHS repeat-associated protein
MAYDGGVAGPGNITSQTGVGTYTYPAAGQPRPHAVTSLTGTFNGITNPSFVYDANGNMTSRAGSTVTWSSYNYPTDINANDASGAEEVQLSYGPDRQRWKQIYTAPGTTENTYYIGGLLEKVVSGSTTNYRHYIYAGREVVAVYSHTAAGVNTMSYMLEDHQGGVSNIASNSGTSDVNESFSAFGARRNPTTWSGAPTTGDLNTIAGLSRQGYTFQTWLGQSMGLNHMNGRVEDAILGRFLSPDPHITDPSNAQSYNRYSYVNNNPVTFTDPTGFDTDCGNKPCDYAIDGGPPAGDDGGGDSVGAEGGDSVSVEAGVTYSSDTSASPYTTTSSCGTGCTQTCDSDGNNCVITVTAGTAAPSYNPILTPGTQPSRGGAPGKAQSTGCPKPNPADFSKDAFLNTQFGPASSVASTYGVDPTLLLGLSALESGWGSSSQARNQFNPFGATPGGDSTAGLGYSSYSSAWNSWGNSWGARVNGVGSDTSAFLNALLWDNRGFSAAVDQRGSYNSENPLWSASVANTIASVQARLPGALAAFSPGCQ